MFYSYFSTKTELQTNWHVTVTNDGEQFVTGEAIDFHFFLEDERGQTLEGAKVTATFDRVETVHQIDKKFRALPHGLYGTEIIFSLPGTWIMMLDVKKGKQYYKNQYIFEVTGPIVAKENRDPHDSFTLDQPLPKEIRNKLYYTTPFHRK